MIARLALTCLCALFVGYTFANESDQEGAAYVIGASVSMGFNLFGKGHSPSLYALEQIGYERDQIVKKTVITGSFRRKVGWLEDSFAERPPELIIGIDLFHHDVGVESEVKERTLAYVDEILTLMCDQGVPVIVGDLWTRRGSQENADQLNEYLRQQAIERENLYIFPTGELMTGIKSDDESYEYQVDDVSLTIDKYRGRELLLDIAHPNGDGARMMANMIIDLINRESETTYEYYDVADVVEKINAIPLD